MSKIVVKTNGKEEEFNNQKIFQSIWNAAQDVGGKDPKLAESLRDKTLKLLTAKYPNSEKVTTAQIGDVVEKILIENGHAKTAKAYILFRENKKHGKHDRDSLGVTDDIGLSYNALYLLKIRFLKRNDKGEIIETPRKMIERVARFLANVEKTSALRKKWFKKFVDIMIGFDFLPGGRTITNAGKANAQLSNCFVWPVEDDLDGIFNILHKSTMIKRHGGGCGYNFSKVRPEGDSVGGIPNLSCGPIRMMEMFDLTSSLFKQEGKYESGNMAILNTSHPDIFNFISAKQTDGYLSRTNISISITDEFMEAALNGKPWYLINPRTMETVNTVSAKSILELAAQMAWATGDPGIINLSAMNKGTKFANPLLKECGMIAATNPCGEVPLYPYESCNLGQINLVNFIKDQKLDFVRLTEVMKVAVRLMDNVIDASWYPVQEIIDSVKAHRRIGIGVVGWAEALIMLNIPYDSKKALDLAEKLAKTMYEAAHSESIKLAKEKGAFPLVNKSIWAKKKDQPRNVAVLTFPPTSNIALICETSYGIEPLFAVAYEQNVLGGERLITVNKLFIQKLKDRGFYSEELIQKVVENNGSVQGIKEIPEDIQKVFRVAHDINWQDHIKMQAAFQKWTDNAITKTINMPAEATPDDIEKAYVLAWKLGCKGLTVYRDRTKTNQVFQFGSAKTGAATDSKKLCPNCESVLVRDGKCIKCKKCGFSTCEL
jgi:ribonucleoside-diphosphate reductase alpha chain